MTKKIADRIKFIEIQNIKPPTINEKYTVKDRSNEISEDSRIIIHFKNGGKLQIREPEGKESPIEESFKPNDPHSVWDKQPLDGSAYEGGWNKEKRIRMATKWDIEEMEKRAVDDQLNDWENLQNCFSS